jgi:PST family polysaccharide transporter
MSQSDLRGLVFKGVTWRGVSQVTTQLFSVVITIVLARLLLPKDFGLVGMAAIFTGLVSVLGEIGFGAAIIHRKELREIDLSTVFWSSVAAGLAVWVVAAACSPLAAVFFRNETVRGVIVISSVAFIVNSFGIVHRVLLNKELAFNRLAATEIGAVVCYGVATIALATAGAGVWSLVVGGVVKNAAEVALLWRVKSWRPSFGFSKRSFRELFGFGVSVWGFSLMDYARSNVDYLVVGRVLGPASLGFYTMAYNLSDLPRRQLSGMVSNVTFPAFAKIQEEDERLRRAYTKVVRCVSLAAFPVLSGLAVIAPELIPMVYGPRWTPVVLPLQILCGAGMLYSVGATVGSVYLAKGRPDLQLKVGIVAFVVLAAMVLAGVRFGVVGVASAVLTYAVTSLLLGQAVANSLIKLKMSAYVRALLPAAAGSCVMVLTLVVYRAVALNALRMPEVGWLASAICLGVGAYLGLLLAAKTPEIGEVISLAGQAVAGGVRSIGRRLAAGPRPGLSTPEDLGDAQ